MTPRLILFLTLTIAQFALMPASHGDTTVAEVDYPKKIHFRNIMQNQDIALGEVESILQDYQGFMWLGGRNALLRYDGYEFLPISAVKDPTNVTETEPVNQVLELLEDKHHNLWAATRSGLYRYDRDREVLLPIDVPAGLLEAGGAINAIAESPTGDILIGTATGFGILDQGTGAVTILNQQNGGLPSNQVNDILMDQDNVVWLGLDSGLAQMDFITRKVILHLPSPENPKSTLENTLRTLAVDRAGRVWGGSDLGIFRFDRKSQAFTRYQHNPKDPTSLPINFLWSLYVDNSGRMWVGTDGAGLSLYNEPQDNWLSYSRSDGGAGQLSSNVVRRIYEDRTGDIWVGTYPSGVHLYDRSSIGIRAYQKSAISHQGPMDNNVEAVVEDKEGKIWVGANGVSRFDPQTDSFTHYPYAPGEDSPIAAPNMLYGTIDSQNRLLFGSWGAGVQVYNPTTDRFDSLPVDPDQSRRGEKTGSTLNDLMVWNVFEDREHNIWFGTHYNGLTKFDRKTGVYSFFPHSESGPHSLSSAVTWVSYEDSQGRFWVGTAYGLNLMNRENNSFKRYLPDDKNPRSLANGSVLAIYEDSKKRLWFGTDMGLHLYHPETDDFTHYGTRNGFADPGIRAITQDHQGNLWVGTNNGVVRFNPDTLAVKNYTRFNGALIGGITTGAVTFTRANEVVFGSRNGVYFFDVDQLESNQNQLAPAIAITDFRLFTEKVPVHGPHKLLDKVITQTSAITLNHTQSMISFSFAALNYRDTEKNLYAYKLEGFDNQWREVGNQRTALYTNLPAGSYRFRVKASNNDGIWNEEGRSLQLTVLPPPWKTWWAYTLYISVVIGLLLMFVRTQHQKVVVARNISRELEHKVTERTAELRNKNAELEGAYAQLEAISLSDPLTGLNNRRYLQKLIPMDIAKVQREYAPPAPDRLLRPNTRDLTFFILDVDFFKAVNDTHGHAAGDQLLIQLSDTLTKICRESDCVVRWGGEEFLIVSRFADRDEAPLMAERIRKSIEQHNFTLPDGNILKKTCSMGFASFPFLREHTATLSWEQVIDIADRALYAAKKSGRNRCVGLAANDNTPEDNLYPRISRDLSSMIYNNELAVISPSETPLVWA